MISIRSLHKYFNKGKQNEIHVINDISLELPEQGMVALFGRSGCGKTTLLNAIGGLDKTESGSILIDGKAIKSNPDVIRNQYIGYIFQNYNLNNQQSCFENVANALRLCGMTDKTEIEERVMAALTNVGMEKYKSRTPDTLSGGQMQRIAIARAIVKNPKIILADEPTGNLDETNTILIMDLLKKIAENHLVILVTHEANLVDYYCDKVIELSDGKIVSTRDNHGANGFAARSKNDIYLGELNKTEAAAGGVNVEYYGQTTKNPIKLRIVNSGGKIYLSVDDESIQLLDKTSEVKLREGVYTEVKRAEENKANIDMSKLPPIEGTHFGRLFNFKGSFKSGYNANFKKNKKSTKALRACMFLFSLVLVFMSASFGTAFKTIDDVQTQYNQNMFYVYTTSFEISEKLNAAVGQHGIDTLQITSGIPIGTGSLIVSPGRFESFATGEASFKTSASLLDIKFAGTPTYLAGNVDKLSDKEVVITSVLADRLIEGSTVGYIKSHSDLIGLYADFSSVNLHAQGLRIVGVIKSDENVVYRSSLSSAQTVLRNMGISVQPNKHSALSLNSGEAYLAVGNESQTVGLLTKGQTLKINGKTFTVKDVLQYYHSYDEYLASIGSPFVEMVTYDEGDKQISYPNRITLDSWCSKIIKQTRPDLSEGTHEFYVARDEYKKAHFVEYYEQIYSHLDGYIKHNYIVGVDVHSWLYVDKGITDMKYYQIYDNTIRDYYYIQHLKELKGGENPTYEEVFEGENISEEKDTLFNSFREELSQLNEQHRDEFYRVNPSAHNRQNNYIISEADYINLANFVGESHESVTANGMGGEMMNGVVIGGNYSYMKDSAINTNTLYYTAIHSSNIAATEAFLSQFSSTSVPLEYQKAVYTPSGIFDELMSDFKTDVISKISVLIIFLVVMSLCMYFIMRSSLMTRIKEVGIYRAIGVSKKNLAFRFFVEALVLTTFTVFIGYLISSGILFGLAASVSLLDTILYYPVWLAGAVLAVLYAVCLICGLIPVFSLLRKTPSEILSKYDI